MKKVNWLLIFLILIGFVVGGLLGSYFHETFLSYGKSFGLSSPVVLDLGFLILTFGLTIQINIASILGVIVALVAYRFLR